MRLLVANGALIASVVWVMACGGEASNDSGAASGSESQAAAVAAEESPGGTVDPAAASKGGEWLRSKGCTACHTVGDGRLVGPDLAGVTERRTHEFILAMITNPDSMLASDETAKGMLGEYFTPMPNQGVSVMEAEAIYQYLRQQDEE